MNHRVLQNEGIFLVLRTCLLLNKDSAHTVFWSATCNGLNTLTSNLTFYISRATTLYVHKCNTNLLHNTLWLLINSPTRVAHTLTHSHTHTHTHTLHTSLKTPWRWPPIRPNHVSELTNNKTMCCDSWYWTSVNGNISFWGSFVAQCVPRMHEVTKCVSRVLPVSAIRLAQFSTSGTTDWNWTRKPHERPSNGSDWFSEGGVYTIWSSGDVALWKTSYREDGRNRCPRNVATYEYLRN